MYFAISGLDGAGKSTQIGLLQSYLAERGLKSRQLWARGGYTPGFEALKAIARRFLGKKHKTRGPSKHRTQAMNKKGIASIWLQVAMLDLILFWGIYARFLVARGHVVIFDRYLLDTKLDFRRNFPGVFNESSILWRLLTRVVPQPDASLILWITVENSQKRSLEKNEPFPDTAETLAWRLESYLQDHKEQPDASMLVDCNEPLLAVKDQIQSIAIAAIDGASGKR